MTEIYPNIDKIKRFVYTVEGVITIIIVANLLYLYMWDATICFTIGMILIGQSEGLFFKGLTLYTVPLKKKSKISLWKNFVVKRIKKIRVYIRNLCYLILIFVIILILLATPFIKYVLTNIVQISEYTIFNLYILCTAFLLLHVAWLVYGYNLKLMFEKKYKKILMTIRAEKEVAEKKLLAEAEVYEVPEIEDVFLVYYNGTLITHVTKRLKGIDSDVLMGMLTAIQDFVMDSFKKEKEGMLNKLHYGNLTILIEHDEFAYLAVVLSGKEHPKLRKRMKLAIATIHKKYRNILRYWDDDVTKFKDVDKIIEHTIISPIFDDLLTQKEI
jgi:hypothetical protein